MNGSSGNNATPPPDVPERGEKQEAEQCGVPRGPGRGSGGGQPQVSSGEGAGPGQQRGLE